MSVGQRVILSSPYSLNGNYDGTYSVYSIVSSSSFTILNSSQPGSIINTNSVGSSWAGTSFLPPFIDALRTTISRFRASTVSKNITAVPRTITSNQINTGTDYQAFQNGDVFYITLPSDYDGGAVALNFIGGGSGTTGGTISIVDSYGDSFTINGAATNQFTTSGYGLYYPGNTPRVGQVARISGLTAGVTHVLTCTVTSANTTVDFDSWQIESSFPNPVIIANIANINYSDYSSIQTWNNAISVLVNEFPGPISVANIQDLLNGNMISHDGIHPSELGGIYIAEEVRKSYTRMNIPLRGFISSSSNNIKTGLSTYPIANFRTTRDHGSSTIKSLALGQTGLTPLGSWSIVSNVSTFTPQYLAPLSLTTYFIPVRVVEPCTVSKFTCVSNAGSTGTTGFGLYYDWLGLPGNLMYDAGTTSSNTTSNKVITLPTGGLVITTPGIYWIAMYIQGTATTLTNMRVAALTGIDPIIPNFDSAGTPIGSCIYTSAPSTGSSLPGVALGAFSTSFTVSDWSPQVYMTLTGNY